MSNIKLLNEKETAELLGLNRRTLSYWRVYRKELDYVKARRRVLYRLCDIEAWIEKGRVKVKDDWDPERYK